MICELPRRINRGLHTHRSQPVEFLLSLALQSSARSSMSGLSTSFAMESPRSVNGEAWANGDTPVNPHSPPRNRLLHDKIAQNYAIGSVAYRRDRTATILRRESTLSTLRLKTGLRKNIATCLRLPPRPARPALKLFKLVFSPQLRQRSESAEPPGHAAFAHVRRWGHTYLSTYIKHTYVRV